MTETKRGRGRPAIAADGEGERYTIVLPSHIAIYLKALGAGSISRGIVQQTIGGPPVAKPLRVKPKKVIHEK